MSALSAWEMKTYAHEICVDSTVAISFANDNTLLTGITTVNSDCLAKLGGAPAQRPGRK